MKIANDLEHTNIYRCRVCRSTNIEMLKEGNIRTPLKSNDFRITDDRYGLMLSIFKCTDCGFLQCLDAPDTRSYYKTLEDQEYETSRKERMRQARIILNRLMKVIGGRPEGLRLLDVGAGSGILLEAASELGFDAEGVEPSDWLRMTARKHGCKINADVIPHPEILGLYDIVTLIDVVEHVSEPYEMIQNVVMLLKAGGTIVIVTPDVKSLAARLMSWKWWHYRIAHVGYFNKGNIEFIFFKLGLIIISVSRPSWVFSVAYIRNRLLKYLPDYLVMAEKPWMHNITINLNLRDSLMIIGKRPQRDL